MYVWEMVSCRLRGDGWQVWHATEPPRPDAAAEPFYRVHLQRPGCSYTASGPTLTDAYAAAARRARQHAAPARQLAGTRG